MTVVSRIHHTAKNDLIYILDNDRHFVSSLKTKFDESDYLIHSFFDLHEFHAAIIKKTPAVIIVDGTFIDSQIFSELKKQYSENLIIICVAKSDTMEIRLSAVRIGAKRFFSKPLNIDDLYQTVNGLSGHIEINPYRILCVDDEEISLRCNQAILEEAGMDVQILSRPLSTLKVLSDFKPDVIVLDVYMPECSGIELAQVIRQDKKWAMVPIVFLSSESDLDKQLATLNLGGDDFLVKPIKADHFATAIIARAKRARMIKRLNQEINTLSLEHQFQFLSMDQHNIVSVTDTDGVITQVNQRFCDVSGYSEGELIGQTHRLLNSGFHPNSFYLEMWNKITHGDIWQGNLCNRKKNGEEFWLASTIVPYLDKDGIPYKYVSIRTDITERVESQQKLRETEKRFTMAVEGAGDGIWDWDIASNKVQFSSNYLDILGYSEPELPNNFDVLDNIIHPQDRVRNKKNLHDYLTGVIPKRTIEIRLQHKDGHYVWVLCRATIVSRSKDQTPIRMIGIQSDISHQKKGEQDLIQARQDAETANHAKSQFLSSMSHELRTPLNAIMGFGQLLNMDQNFPLPPSQKENVDEILKAGKHLQELINEVLDLSRIEAGQANLYIEPVSLTEIILESIQLINPLAKNRGIQFILKLDDQITTSARFSEHIYAVKADHTRLKQVLLNLISNAIKYNRPEAQLIISISSSGEKHTRIAITDNGYGLSDEQQKLLFKPFNRLGIEKTEIEGTGIGLVICKRLIEQMKGNIGFHSQVSLGSTFWIELETDKLAHSIGIKNKELLLSSSSPKTNLQKDKSILYIEDNPANLLLVSQIVELQTDFNLISAHEPYLGLELVAEHQPDLILLDINLPGMNGFEVLKHLKQNEKTQAIPVIAISANAMPQDIQKALSAGFTHYVTKPIDIEKILSVVEEALHVYH